MADVAANPSTPCAPSLISPLQRFIERLRGDPEWARKGEEIRTWLQTDATVGSYCEPLAGPAWCVAARSGGCQLGAGAAGGQAGVMAGRVAGGDAALRQSFNDRLERWVEGLAPDVSAFIAQHIETRCGAGMRRR